MRYPKEFHDFMKEYVPGHHHYEVAEEANRRFGYSMNAKTVKAYCNNHKIKCGMKGGTIAKLGTKAFPKEVYEYIMANYKGISHKDLAEKLNSLFNTNYSEDQISAFYRNHKIKSGLTGRFEKGHVPVSGFKKGVRNSIATEFKKGQTPPNTKPLGYERVSVDGYVEVKVREHKTKQHPNTFDPKHRVVWKEHYGDIPKGMFITFLDGNKMNCDITNLALVSQSENKLLNSKGLRFEDPEMTKAGIGVAKIIDKTNKLKKDRK